jgi:diphosphomevalonate decarboxylase
VIAPARAAGKASAAAPANIALIKYWGARDLARVLPANPSISMTLSLCVSRSTVEHLGGEGGDEVFLAGDGGELAPAPPPFADRVRAHLEVLRRATGTGGRFRVATANTFPAAAGIASSASGFAALTLAVTRAVGLEIEPRRLSDLARRSGSGSAARSLFGGFVEWPAGKGEGEAYAVPLAPAGHWDLRDVIALVETAPKEVSSLEGHRRAPTSPYYASRLGLLPARLEAVRRAIAGRDLGALGPVVEEEAIDLHLIAMSSRPPIFYWAPATLAVLAAVRQLRRDGIGAWATMDAGANVHVLCEAADEEAVATRLGGVGGVRALIRDRAGRGPEASAEPLF